MTVKQECQKLIKSLIGKKTKAEIYSHLVDRYQISRKKASAYWQDLAQAGAIDDEKAIPPVNFPPSTVKQILKEGFYQEGDSAEVTKIVTKRIKTLQDLVDACEIDLTVWEIASWECNKWEVGRKDKAVDLAWHEGVVNGSVDDSGKVFVEPLFQVKAKLKLRKLDTDLGKQKELLLQELFNKAPATFHYQGEEDISTRSRFLLELALFDVHFGKLAHSEESGEDYDLKIAAERYREAIYGLLDHIDTDDIDRILLPIGQDMFNVDNGEGTTTAGTPQDTDTRFYKMVRVVKNLLIEVVNELAAIAPIDIVVVAGNHDEQTSFLLGEILDAYYHNTERVIVQNSASLRKYYEYGVTSIMLTHGDKEKHANLGMIFAAENPQLWARTTQRYIQLGHYHSNKTIQYLKTQDFQGFQIQILPSLSSADAWHKNKGF
jgi:hypothetical protein